MQAEITQSVFLGSLSLLILAVPALLGFYGITGKGKGLAMLAASFTVCFLGVFVALNVLPDGFLAWWWD